MEYNFISCSLTKLASESFDRFGKKLLKEISTWKDNTHLAVFPEYCWGETNANEIINFIEKKVSKVNSNINLIMGTTIIKNDDNINLNQALILKSNGDLEFKPKTHPLAHEMVNHNILPGNNNSTTNIAGLNVAILICADLWDANLVEKLITQNNANVVAVPAFTTVPKGYSNYAKMQWYSLGLVRSREFIVPIIIADHKISGNDYDVGNASCIIDPSLKKSEMSSFDDFLYLSQNNTVEASINLDEVKSYRDYRINTGLYNHK